MYFFIALLCRKFIHFDKIKYPYAIREDSLTFYIQQVVIEKKRVNIGLEGEHGAVDLVVVRKGKSEANMIEIP